jgi:hypothetical protein
MRAVRSVHSRDLPAGIERVGELMESLAGEHDQLWPTERWPTTPIELDRGLELGSRGGHGVIHYSVAEHEPGRKVVFRFEPGSGLEGTHRLDIEPLSAEHTRLVHTLDAGLTGMLAPLTPALLAMHDTLVEDLLDRAELATSGRIAEQAPLPGWMRAMNAVEARLLARDDAPSDRSVRSLGTAVPAALAGIAAVHAAWALGWRWPGGSDKAFAERVIGTGELPPEWATWAVAGLLASAAAMVRTTARGSHSTVSRAGSWTVAGVLLARGTAGMGVSAARGLDSIYSRLDAFVYSPLCLTLGAGTALVAERTSAAHQSSR